MLRLLNCRRVLLCSLVLIVSSAALLAAEPQSSLPDRYRDLKMYSFSEPDKKDSSLILVTTKVRNEGKKPLDVRATLNASEKAGFAGSEFKKKLAPGAEEAWNWQFKVPEKFRKDILRGAIYFGNTHDRDLYVALLGQDLPPDEFSMGFGGGGRRERVDPIDDKAAVVATYLPRRAESIRASRKAKAKPAAELTLATNGATKYRIVLPEKLAQSRKAGETIEQSLAAANLNESERSFLRAVSDLQRCIKLQSGAELPIAAAGDTASPAIRLKDDSSHSLRQKWEHPDGYALTTESNGDVQVAAETLEGLRQGIYGLLTDHLDCHWFQPGKIGEEIIVPADRTVRLPKLKEEGVPAFFSAGGVSWGSARDWDCRMRSLINQGRMTFGHSWYTYVNNGEYPYNKFPEMYARDPKGKVLIKDSPGAHTNFCSTNPKVIDLVAKKINDSVKGNKAQIVVSLDPEDYSPMCLCENCLALDAKYGQKKKDGQEVADRLLHFSKEVYDRLAPENKHLYLGILIYGHQMELPVGAKAHPHHAGLICNFPPRYDHTRPFNDPTSEKNRDFMRLVKGWGSLLTQLGYYDYYGHWSFFGPWVMTHKMREDLPVFRELGGTFLILEAQPNFASQGINHYVASRLAWDINIDVDEVLDEFFEKYYGPAETAMRNYWLGAERRFALTRPGTNADRAARDPEFATELEAALKQAEQAVAGAEVPQRFKDRVGFVRDGFSYWQATKGLPRRRATGGRQVQRLSGVQLERRLEALAKASVVEKAMKSKYTGSDGYYPTFLASYFWPDYENQINELKKSK